MGEERIQMPLTPEITEPKEGSFWQSSSTPDINETKDVGLLRSSTGITSTSSSGEKFLPHYLRASTGSCHDFCKYGRKHAFEVSDKNVVLNKKKSAATDGQHPIKTVSVKMRRKKPVVEVTSSPDPGTQSCDTLIQKHAFGTREKTAVEVTFPDPGTQSCDSIIQKHAFRTREKTAVEVTFPDPGTQSCDSIIQKHAYEIKEKHSMLNEKKTTSSEDQPLIKFSSPETRRKKPVVKVNEKKITLSEGQPLIKSLSPKTRRKKPVVKMASSSDPRAQSCNAILQKYAFEVKEMNPILNRKGITSSGGQSPIKSAIPQTRKKKPAVKLTSSPDPGTQSFNTPDLKTQDTKVVGQTDLSPAKRMANVVKSSVGFQPKCITEKSPSSSSLPPRDQIVRRESDVNKVRNSGTSKTGQKKELVPQKPAVSPTSSSNRSTSLNARKPPVPKRASPINTVNKVKKDESILSIDENVSEKKLYVIQPQPVFKSLELDPAQDGTVSSFPPPSLALLEEEESIDSEYDETETDSEYDESGYEKTGNQNQYESSKGELYRRPRRTVRVHPEDNDPGHKLKFKRGKVVDLKSENNGPRRLRFRKRRVLGDDQNGKGDVGRKNFQKREVNDSAVAGEPESEKVVLRHQDVNGKKDAQGLFNNVIEETASKLAETRKSKVKALVGAFETVISLQESKPSAIITG